MITYIPAQDKLLLKFQSIRNKLTKEFGRFKLWWDDEGNICAIAIMPFLEELKEFEKIRNWTQLGGIWKGIGIDEEDIKEIRRSY